MKDERKLKILSILWREYDNAMRKHPTFEDTPAAAVSVITEELGELAKEVNNEAERNRLGLTETAFRERALIEAAHVAVTAIRTMEMLADNETR